VRALKLPPLTALHYFTCAAKHLSFTKAAAELHVTEGAVSRQMKLLAEYYAKPLFEKNGRGIKLTAQGTLLQSVAFVAFEDIAAVSAALLVSDNQLTINVTTSFAIRWLLPRLFKFEQSYPEYNVQLQATSSVESTRGQAFDVQISYQLQAPVTVHKQRRKLLDEKLLCVCSPSYLVAGAALTLEALGDEKLILNEMTGRDWRLWGDLLNLLPLPVESALKFEQDDVAIQAAVAGHGIALANVAYIERELSMGSLVPATEQAAIVVGAHYLTIHSARTQSNAVRAFSQWLLAEVTK